jgi:hypothetical protein
MAARDTSAKGRRGAGVADFRPQQRNANRHTIHGMARLEDSIRRDGYLTPMTAAASGEVFDGSARLETVAEILDGVEPIVVESDGTRPIIHVRTDIPTAEDPRAKRLALAANKVAADNLDWDPEVLAALQEEGATEGLFSDEDLAMILAGAEPEATEGAGGDEFDTTPEEGPTRVQPGELWALGDHRLLCGDSTKAEDVARVMEGERAVLMNTDPPYGVSYDHQTSHDAKNDAYGENKQYRTFDKIAGDDLTGEQLQAFLEAVIRTAVPHLDEHAAFYLWHPMLTQGTFFAAAAAAAADILIHRQIIWVKPHFIFGRGDYHWRHELCFYGWQRGNRPPFYGERNQHTVWTLDEGGGGD